jgi:hypothetical protein
MPGTHSIAAFAAAAAAPPPPAVGLGQALRRALREARGRVVLRVEEAAPHRRRVARALLQEGALAAGGQVLDGPGGDLLLIGAEADRAARLRALLERLVGPAGTLIWSLERDAASLLAYAAGGRADPPRALAPGPGLAALDAHLDRLGLADHISRTAGWPVAHEAARPAFLRLEPDRARLAAALGALGGDADLLDHAARRLATRLLAALADPAEARALIGPTRAPRLHLPLPAAMPRMRDAAPGTLVGTLPLATDPAALRVSRDALAAAGIGLELDGLDADTLGLIEPAALPPVLLRLRWSPGLRGLHGLDPARVALAGAGMAARDFARAVGIPLVETAAP